MSEDEEVGNMLVKLIGAGILVLLVLIGLGATLWKVWHG